MNSQTIAQKFTVLIALVSGLLTTSRDNTAKVAEQQTEIEKLRAELSEAHAKAGGLDEADEAALDLELDRIVELATNAEIPNVNEAPAANTSTSDVGDPDGKLPGNNQ